MFSEILCLIKFFMEKLHLLHMSKGTLRYIYSEKLLHVFVYVCLFIYLLICLKYVW